MDHAGWTSKTPKMKTMSRDQKPSINYPQNRFIYIYIYIYIYIELAQLSNLKLFLIQLLLFFYPYVLLNHLSASVIRFSLLWLTTHQTSNFFKVRSLNLVLKLL